MADISVGPDLLARLLSRIEDGSARVLPGEHVPNMMEKVSEDLARLNADARSVAKLTGRPAKGKLVLTIEVVAGPGNGEVSPCEHLALSVVTAPKRPKMSRPAYLDDEGSILGSDPRQLELSAVVTDKATPKASRKVV
jgi:hypothetical protein